MMERLLAASIHALLGLGVAWIACRVLRHAAADVRNWIWRVALAKPLLALTLTIPVAILPAAQVAPPEALPTPGISAAPLSAAVRAPEAPPSHQEGIDVEAFALGLWAFGMTIGLATLVRSAGWPPKTDMPRVVGVLRPKVVLPETLKGEARRLAFAHEAAHVRRRDPFWGLLGAVACVTFWFLPPMRWALRAMREEAEMACDAAVLARRRNSARSYGRLLLSFASAPAGAVALSGPARTLARRLEAMQRETKRIGRRASLALAFMTVIAFMPWRAVATFGPGETPRRPASALWLAEFPGVERAMRISQEQKKANSKAALRSLRELRPMWETVEAMRRAGRSPREFFAYDARHRSQIFRAENDARGAVYDADQWETLRGAALQYFGPRLLIDPGYGFEFPLTASQRERLVRLDARVKDELRAIRDEATWEKFLPMLSPQERATRDALRDRYLEAKGGERDRLSARIYALNYTAQARYLRTHPQPWKEIAAGQQVRRLDLRETIRRENERVLASFTPEQRQRYRELTGQTISLVPPPDLRNVVLPF